MKNTYKYTKRVIAWMMLVVIGINCFGLQLQPGVMKVQAIKYDDEDYQRGSEEAEDVIRAAEKAAGIQVDDTEEQSDSKDSTASLEAVGETVLDPQQTGEEVQATEADIEEYEAVTISTKTTLTEDMEVGNLTVSEDLHLNGYRLTIHGNLQVNEDVYVEEGILVVKGNLQEGYYANIRMTSYNDAVQVDGDYIYANSYAQEQIKEKGTWEIKGDIIGVSGSKCADENVFSSDLKVVLNGNTLQTIDMTTDSGMMIQHLVIENTSEEGVFSKHILLTENFIDTEQKLHYIYDGDAGNTLTEDITVEGDYYLTAGTLDLAGYNMTVQGDFIHAGGEILFHGGSLEVEGDYKQQFIYEEDESTMVDYSAARLVMKQAEDYMRIAGDFVNSSRRDMTEDLVEGTIELQGSMLVEDGLVPVLFQAGGNHTVKLTGGGNQILQAGEAYVEDSIRFSYLTIAQPEGGSVSWEQPIAVVTGISHESANISGVTRLESGVIHSANLYGDILIPHDYSFQADVVIHGNVTVGEAESYNTQLKLAECQVTIQGALNNIDTNIAGVGANSVLIIQNDYIPSAKGSSMLSNMVMKIGGTIASNENASLSCGEDVEVHFVGTTQQSINISHGDSLFTNVVVDNPSGVVVADNIAVVNVFCKQGVLSYVSGGIHGFTVEEDGVYAGDLVISGGSLNLNGHSYHVKGNLTIEGGSLNMTNAEDYLLVDGDFVTSSNISHNGKLTNGVLEVKGDFTQSGEDASFATTKQHTVVLSGSEQQTVRFEEYEDSYFCNLRLENEVGITTTSTATAIGTVTQNGPFDGCLGMKRTTVLKGGKFQGNLLILENYYMAENWKIEGNLETDYNVYFHMYGYELSAYDVNLIKRTQFYIDEGHLKCQNLNISDDSTMRLLNATDRITVQNDAYIASGYYYKNGYITVGGDMELTRELAEAVIVELNGTTMQTITMQSGNGCFGKIIVSNTSDEGIYIAEDLNYVSLENLTDAKITLANGGMLGYTLEKDTVIDDDMLLAAGVMDLNGYHLTVNGNLQQTGGNIQLNGGTLTVKGDYQQQAEVSLDDGEVRIEGNWSMGKDVTGSSTTIYLMGNISDTSGTYVELRDACTLQLIGSEKQTLEVEGYTMRLGNLIVDNSSGVEVLNNRYLDVYGDLKTSSNPVIGWINCYGTIADDVVQANLHFPNDYSLQKDLYVEGNVKLGRLKLNGCHLTVTKECMMNYTYYGVVEQKDGILEIKGDVTYSNQYTKYYSSGTNQVILSGDAKQTITAYNADWSFNELIIRNTSEEGVYSSQLFDIKSVSDPNGKLSFPYEGIAGYTLTKDTVIQGDVTLLCGNMDLNGYQLTVTGDFVQRGGRVTVNKGKLQVEGDYTLGYGNGAGKYYDNAATLIMQNEEDYVCVNGEFAFAPGDSQTSYMTNGILEVKGDLGYYHVNSVWQSLPEKFTILLSGKEQQNIYCGSYNYFNLGTLEIRNTSPEGVVVQDNLKITHPVIGGEKLHGTTGKTLYWESSSSPQFDSWEGNIQVNTPVLLTGDLNVFGTLIVNANIDVNGKHLTVDTLSLKKTLTIQEGVVQVKNNVDFGTVYSDKPQLDMGTGDVLQITGNLTATKGTLNLTAGHLEVKGNVNLSGATVVAGEEHVTTLSGKITTKGTAYIQEITIAEGTTLNKLVLTKPRAYYVFSRDVEGMCRELVDDIQDITPPTAPVGLSATEIDYTKLTVSWQEATDDTAIAGYDLYRNDKKIMSLSGTSYTDKNLTPGTDYSYYVIAKDATLNTSAATEVLTVSTLEDTEAPTIPEQLVLAERMATALRLVWNPSTDNVKTAGYRIYRDGEEIATTTYTDYLDIDLDINSLYSYEITSYDAQGNESECSEKVKLYTQTVAIKEMSPVQFGELSGDTVNIKLIFENAGSSNGYQVYMGYREEGQEAYTELVSKTYGKGTAYRKEIPVKTQLDTTALTAEEVELLVRITDAGGYTLEEQYTYYMDKTAPSVITEVGGEVKDGVAVISYAKGTELDIAGYYIYRQEEGQAEKLLVDITEEGKTYYYDKTIEAGITYTYYVAAYDQDGHIGEKSQAIPVTGTPDESAPVIESVEPIDETIHGNTTITIKARDNKELEKAVVEVYDEATQGYELLAECNFEDGIANYQLDTTVYAEEVTLRITVSDTSGNENEEEYSKTYPVDNEGPAKIENFVAEIISTTVVLSWGAPTEDDFSYFLLEEQLEDGTWEEIARTTTVTGYSVEGLEPLSSHTYRVTGFDTSGNAGEVSEELTVMTEEDTVTPRITGVTPNGGYFADTIPLQVQAYDNVKVASVIIESSVDKENWTEVTRVVLEEPSKQYTVKYNYSLEPIEEGDLYIRTYAVDTKGNVGDTSQILIQYVIDKTTPCAVANLKAQGDKGCIYLAWNEPVENDIAKYQVYRSPEGINAYNCIADKITTLDYYDRSAAYDTSYTYKVVAVDQAGNISEYSNVAIAQRMPDDEAPTIQSLLPDKDSWISGMYEFSAYVADNDQIASVEFALQEQTEDSTRMVVDTVRTDISSGTVTCNVNTTAYANGTYQLLVTAKDATGNISETFTSLCHINNVELPTPQLFATAGNWRVGLSYSGNEEDSYIVYKKKINEDSYSILTSGTGSLFYNDLEVYPYYTYVYQLVVIDKAGNEAESALQYVKPIAVDDRKPVVELCADTSVIAGYEVAFSGLGSTDNDRIQTYEWDFGDNTDLQYGPSSTHTYRVAGDYYVTLTVTDPSGNSTYEKTKVTVLPKSASGKALVKVQNDNGTPLGDVSVYVNSSDEKNDICYTDSKGLATIMQKPGTYRVALYKPGYVATEVEVEIELYGEREYVFTLPDGDTMTADFEVRQLTFEEIVAAGIDVTAPENQHVFTVQTTLTFMPASRPLVMTLPMPRARTIIHTKSKSAAGGGGGGGPIGGNNAPNLGETEAEEALGNELYYTMCITSSISWLKDMYEATLIVYNNANSQTIVARDLISTLQLPTGIALAGTKDGQSLEQEVPDIRGGESESVTWYVRGDVPGKYTLQAMLNGTLQPFEADFSAQFESEEFEVTAGEGLVLLIKPEDRAEKAEQYYVHFELKNEGSKEFYNIKTSFGDTFNNSKRFAATASGTKTLPVMSAGDMLIVDCLKPGESISGIYKTVVHVTGEKFRDYMELVDYEYDVLSGANLGVRVGISPVASHVPVPAMTYQTVADENFEADPVNVSTGAYTDEFSALSIQGVNPVSALLSYDSNAVSDLGEFGYGWTHNYEARLLDMKDGTIRYYVSPTGYYTFLAEDFEKAEYKLDENGYYYLDISEIPMEQTYKCLNETDAEYDLKRDTKGAFTLTDAAETVLKFDKKGNLRSIKNSDGKSITIKRDVDGFTVKDDASGRELVYVLNDDKLVQLIRDSSDRTVCFYYDENQCLKQFVNAMGESTYYTYDENHRILTVTDDNGNTYVKNEYKEFDSVINATKKAVRVVNQKDGLGNSTTFDYQEDEQSGDLITTVTTRSGETKKTITDYYGNVTCNENEAGDKILVTYDEDGNQTAVNNANGYSVVYGYDSDGNMTTIENSLMNGDKAETVMTYDSDGNMLTMENCNGEIMKCTYYEDSGLIKTAADQNGNTISYTYNNRGQITEEKDANGRTIKYNYDESGDLTSVTDKNGNVTQYNYNELGLVESTIVKDGNQEYITSSYYDDMGRVDYTIDTEGGVTSYEYDCAGNIKSRTDPGGAMTVYQYDRNYQLVKETTYPSEDEDAKSTSTTDYTYTKEGLLKTVTDGKSGTTITNTYDVVGNKTKEVETDKEGNVLSELHYEYDQAGNVTKQTQVNLEIGATEEDNLMVEALYYPNGKLNYVVDTAGKKTTYSYDKSWRVSSIVSETQPMVSYTYDSAGRVLSETVGEESDLAQTVSYTYDIYGNVLTETDQEDNVTTYRYDNNGNLTEIEDATYRVIYSKYDALNRVVETGMRKPGATDADNISLTRTTYNIAEHTITETDVVNGGSVTTHYDEAGRPYKTTDAKRNILSEIVYDSEGRILQTVDANGLVSENVYNGLMQIATVRTGAKGNKNADGTYKLTGEIRETAYTYDDLGRTTKVTEGAGEDQTISSVVFDGLGRIQSMKDPNQNASEHPVNTYSYEYNEQGLLAKETNAIGNVTEYQYNADLLLASVKDSANETTSYSYDSLNRLTSVKDELGTITYTYDANGNVTDVTETENWVEELVNTGNTIHREFDSLNRVTEYTDYKGRTVKYAYDMLGNMIALTYPGGEIVTYEYFDDGNVKTMTSKSGGTYFTWEYSYDQYGRLQKITRPDDSVEERIYDAAGNLTQQVDKNKDGEVIQKNTYVYNVFGEITEKSTSNTADVANIQTVTMEYDSANRLTKYNDEEVTYDAKGNMTYGPVDGIMQELTYDCRNRLIRAGGVTYTYDAENTRIATTENEKTTEYVTDTGGSLSKLLVAYEADGTETSYYYGAEGLAGQYNSGTEDSLYYHFDNIGSTTLLTNQAGTVIERFVYGTYGELLSDIKTAVRFLYNGAYGVATDSNGLYYMRARYYNPDIKRFINQDIKVGDIGSSQSLNRYAYCEGNPISLIDPFGLSPQASQDQGTKESKYSAVHGLLDFLGLFFDGADIINAGLYAAEGDWKNAAICAATAIPVVGGVILGIAKGAKAVVKAKKAAKLAELAAEASRMTKNAANTLDTFTDTMKTVTKYGSDTFKYTNNLAGEFGAKAMRALETGGDFGQEAGKAARKLNTAASPSGLRLSTKADEAADALKTVDTNGVGGCFVAGTKIKTEAGEKNVEEVTVGDYVLAENPETGEQECKEVVRTFIHVKRVLVYITVGAEEIETTKEHPFYIEGKGFVPAEDLEVGDIIRTADGKNLPIKKVEIEELEEPVLVYNFEVEDFHTYYVSELGVLVHNMCAVSKGGKTTDFYVSPSGDVVPATGYRYVSENAPYLDDMTNNMTIPANADGTYFSFDNYDVANPGALQVPHDASVKVSFDTLQIIDDISVPYGNWGKAPYLEPITTDFPQFGSGGATQVITHSQIRIKSITKLPKN